MIIKDATLTYKPQDTRPEPEGYSIYGWPAALREPVSAEVARGPSRTGGPDVGS